MAIHRHAALGIFVALSLLPMTKVASAATEPALSYKILNDISPAPGSPTTIWFNTSTGPTALGNAYTTVTIHDSKNKVINQQVLFLDNLAPNFTQTLSASLKLPSTAKLGDTYGVDFATWAQTGYTYQPPQTNFYTFKVGAQQLSQSLPPMHLTLNENFVGTALNRTIWSPHFSHPLSMPIDAEFFLPNEVKMLGTGGIRLSADKYSYLGRTYATGAMTSMGGFAQTYGRFEMKAKIPKGQGLWPAFWLLQTDLAWPPEIDVFENLGGDTTKMYQTNHWLFGENNQHQSKQGFYSGVDLSGDYHTYTLDWRPSLLIWSVDGVETYRTTQDVPAKPMYILADLAIGNAGWGGPPNASTVFPASMDIAYIHAYQYDDMPAEVPDPLDVMKASLSSETLTPGETVTIKSGVKVGQYALNNVVVHVALMDILNQQVFNDQYVSLGNLAAGATAPLEVTLAVPQKQAPGWYDVRILASTPTLHQPYGLYTADRIQVVPPTAACAPSVVGSLGPDRNHVPMATRLIDYATMNMSWLRINTSVPVNTGPRIAAVADMPSYQQHGFKTFLTVVNPELETSNGNMSTFASQLAPILTQYKPSMIAVENEIDNVTAVSASNYLAEVKAACAVSHASHIPCTDSGITTKMAIALLVNSELVSGHTAAALNNAQYLTMWYGGKTPTDAASLRAFLTSINVGRADMMIRGIHAAGADSVDLHWYVVPYNLTDQAQHDLLVAAVQNLSQEAGLPIAGGEIGVEVHNTPISPLTGNLIVNALKTLKSLNATPIILWNPGVGLFPADVGAQSLVDAQGTLLPSGQAVALANHCGN